jgi:molybdopterin-synthase adenylyltransferase
MKINPPNVLNIIESFPAQLISVPGGVILKRGCTEIKIGGEGSQRVIGLILAATSTHGVSKADLLGLFSSNDQPMIEHLIDELLQKRILTIHETSESQKQGRETSQEIFYWHFGESIHEIHQRLSKVRFVILGVNTISRNLSVAFHNIGINNFKIIDHPYLRNLHLFENFRLLKPGAWPPLLKTPENFEGKLDPEGITCVIATCDFGHSPVVNEFNSWCIEHNRHFLPVILHNVIGYIGPLVVPGETACFDCLQARQNSHLQNYEYHDALKAGSFEGQHSVGFLPGMAGGLAEFAVMEVCKFYGGILQPKIGTLIEINLLVPHLSSRKILKIPRCQTCSPLKTRPPVSLNKSIVKISSQRL